LRRLIGHNCTASGAVTRGWMTAAA
jgi:hypothetical protein